jgi:hypothetical protein
VNIYEDEILWIKPTWCTIPSLYVYFYSLHVWGNYLPIIRRNNYIYTTPGICHSVWMTDWYAEWDRNGHPHRVTNTRCRIDIVISSDDGHIVARNMYRIEINMQRRNCAPGWFYLQDYTRMQVNKT